MRTAVQTRRFEQNSVQGFLHQPAHPPLNGLALTHGAGGNCETQLLVEVATGFCEAGWLVLRFDLPFRQSRRYGPPMPATAVADRAGLKDAVSAIREMTAVPVFLGGHSYGGRQATLLAAEEPALADALLLLSYPLHPPKRADQLRTSHWPSLHTPSFFVHGTNDPFGSAEEMRSAVSLLPARSELVFVDGAGHDLARGSFDVADLVVRGFCRFVRGGSGA